MHRLLAPFGARLIRVSPNRVRGVDLFLDLQYLLGRQSDLVVFDVGANEGGRVDEFLEHFNRPSIVAFEPFGECYQRLCSKFGGSASVRVENIALGAVRETRPFHLYSGTNMNSLLPMDKQSENVLRDTFTDAGTTEVTVETLDNYCQEHKIARVDLLKVDTQGFDLQVLKGAANLLQAKRVRVILIEVNFIPMYQGQAGFPDIHECLSSHGYRLTGFYEQHYHQNYIAWCDACYVAADES